MKNLNIADKILIATCITVWAIVGFIYLFRKDIKIPDIVITGLIIFTIQALINHILNRNIEKYKDEISQASEKQRHELTRELESFKSDLAFAFTKQSKLHERRSEVISNLYSKLVDLHQKMTEMTLQWRMIPADKQVADDQEMARIKAAGDSYNEFLNFYLCNKIYFTSATCEKIDEIRKNYHGVFQDYTIGQRTPAPLGREAYDRVYKTFNTVNDVIAPILQQIENDFRLLLGVS